MRVLLYPTPQGALTQLWAGTSPETANLNGEVITSTPFTYHERDSRCVIVSRPMGEGQQTSQQ